MLISSMSESVHGPVFWIRPNEGGYDDFDPIVTILPPFFRP